jgi:glutaredoxin
MCRYCQAVRKVLEECERGPNIDYIYMYIYMHTHTHTHTHKHVKFFQVCPNRKFVFLKQEVKRKSVCFR